MKIRENKHSSVTVFEDAKDDCFDTYAKKLEESGFAKKEEYIKADHRFAAYSRANEGVFLNYFATTREFFVTEEENCKYFSYKDVSGEEKKTVQITQLHLEDFGMSYIVRLSDGRFIIFDGGWNMEPDFDRLFECLKSGSDGGKIVIAAWIMTHPHSDHYQCFIGFADKYESDVRLEKVLLNFPEADDTKNFPELTYNDRRFEEDVSEIANIPRMYERIERLGGEIFTAHTGQIYKIGDAVCEILISLDDIIGRSQSINASSIVIRMELCGQVILWAADTSFSETGLADKYGKHLKSDILQVPHHGFQCGDPADEIKGYDYICPKVCLLPVSDFNAYTAICTYRESSRYLMNMAAVEQIITGDKTRTINLPYMPSGNEKREIERQYLSGLDNSGACTWVYTNLSTADYNDFCFTFLNMTGRAAKISADLFFETPKDNIRYVKFEIPQGTFRRICVTDKDAVDDDALYFNWASLKEKKIPKDCFFAIRFISDVPVVISHENHRESYRSLNR